MIRHTLLFVYNADSNLFSRLTDITHKLISPATYACHLCAVTHTVSGMQQQWRQFIDELPVPVAFYHRDEFTRQKQLPEARFPAIFVSTADVMRRLISAEEINNCPDLDSLQILVAQRLQTVLSDKPCR